MDVLARHRLSLLGLDPDALEASPVDARVDAVYAAFVARVPYENLSNLSRRRARPAEPESWPRGTDRLLRDLADHGLGGTCFSMAYALADLFRNVGANAHTVLGMHLRKEESHACTVVWGTEGPRLFDASYFLARALPVWPGASVDDGLFRFDLEARCGPLMTLVQTARDGTRTPLYSLIPNPAPPDAFRRAWLQTFLERPERAVRIARRVGHEVRWFGEEAGRVDRITPDGKVSLAVARDPVPMLHELFGVSVDTLRGFFASPRG